jgi:hypothetical protein
MAKKKTKKKPVAHKKKGRVSGTTTTSFSLTDYLLMGIAAPFGGVAGAFVVNMLDTAAGGKVPLGATRGLVALAGLGGAYAGRKHPIALGLGLGAGATAGVMVANEIGINIPGIAGLVSVGATRKRNHRVAGTMKAVGAGAMQSSGQPPMSSLATRNLRAVGALYSN